MLGLGRGKKESMLLLAPCVTVSLVKVNYNKTLNLTLTNKTENTGHRAQLNICASKSCTLFAPIFFIGTEKHFFGAIWNKFSLYLVQI